MTEVQKRSPSRTAHQKNGQTLQQVEGIVDRLTFHNEESGFTVARLLEKKSGQPLTVVGNLGGVPVGSSVRLQGWWTNDRKYGRQFKIDRFTIIRPNTLRGIERYLGSGLIKGIGPAFAGRIVKQFGLDTLEILDRDPERLQEVRGLGAKRIATIKAAWQQQRHIHDIMIFLQGHDISATFAVKIYKTYGDDALTAVRENPYRLAEDIWGIGFKTADRIAASFGISGTDPRRARAGVVHLLNTATDEGHCFLPAPTLTERARALLEIDNIAPAMDDLARDGSIIREGNAVYLAPLFHAEHGVAANLLRLLQAPARLTDIHQARRAAARAEKGMAISFAPEQRQAIISSLTSKISILTGGPGTGKSTILQGLISILRRKNARILLAAPTGRAAKRMYETTGMEAKTIHRLLEFDPGSHRFRHDRDHPLAADWVIIDEASMLDVVLANSLLRALPDPCHLLLVGDADQLPSVGPGNVFRDVIASGRFPVTRLTTIFRQGAGSLISINARRINNGQSLELLPDYRGDKDFYCIFRETPEEIETEVVSLVNGRLTRKYGYDPVDDIQVLTPMRRGLIGADNLNHRLQELLTGNNPAMGRFRRGDKVMQVRNNYEKEVFNGDLGMVTEAREEENLIIVNMDGRAVEYEPSELIELSLAWAITIHKSQGSEFPCVIIPIHTTHYPLLQRNLLYTAVTRGKKLDVLVGSPKAIAIAIRANQVLLRHTNLRVRLLAVGTEQ